jgi:hypothetical protein
MTNLNPNSDYINQTHPLPEKFTTVHGTFRQLSRQGRYAAYHRWKRGVGPTFEAEIIQTRPLHLFRGKTYHEAEYLPSTAKWGQLGWTFPTAEKAIAKAQALAAQDAGALSLNPVLLTATPCSA